MSLPSVFLPFRFGNEELSHSLDVLVGFNRTPPGYKQNMIDLALLCCCVVVVVVVVALLHIFREQYSGRGILFV